MALSAKTMANLAKVAKPKSKVERVVRSPAPPPPEAVNDHTKQHGLYERDGHRGTINRGGTPIARWRQAGVLDERQCAAIDYCIRLWERAGRHTGLVMDLLKIVGQPPSSGWSQQEALDELSWLKGKIGSPWWDVFENVCRWDEPAGRAGSKLATNKRSSVDAAQLCVRFVADLIGTWVNL
ncbi:hypothetical protein FHS31_000815 [Sphingomonas vulcanisoli]|uniref:Uncharacterized protein n=1 Tax=Sphingomonas vulcanisoli TaxID=1658060 RepID=A0ABX0TSV5_9SPHN|nr:hypothetical protein [Sphingomonas vulcanisoli]NIJ07219.1 hypothetical protein [Sphingomonas vulcanisoli]